MASCAWLGLGPIQQAERLSAEQLRMRTGQCRLISVTRVDDRAELARRASGRAARLDPDDADGRLALATWCSRRQVRDEARRLVGEVLKLRPGDGPALALKATLLGDE